jgi:hypothetical protein
MPVCDDLLINSLPLSSATTLPLELPEWEGEARVDVLEGVEGPAVGLVEEGIPGNSAGSDVCGGEGEDILAGSGLSAVVSD